jgi:polyisoprenoid-binding protein YceI
MFIWQALNTSSLFGGRQLVIDHRHRRRGFLYAASLLLLIALCPRVFAQEVQFEFDPARTTVSFTLSDVLHTVHGTFKVKNGSIHFDAATGLAGGAVVVDATTGDSGSGARDRRMHKDILESQKYPEITFTPIRVQGAIAAQGTSHLEIQGTINLHGNDHGITITAEVQLASGQLTGKTQFPIPYVKWGIKNPSTLFLRVSPTVDIDIQAVGRMTGTPLHQ